MNRPVAGLIAGAFLLAGCGYRPSAAAPTIHPASSLGARVDFSAADAGITFPKQQVNPVNYQNSRIEYEWPRPTSAGTFQLRFQGGGGSYVIPLTIDALS